MQAMGHKVLPVLSSTIELVVKIISAAVLAPAIGYLGVAVTEPVVPSVEGLIIADEVVKDLCSEEMRKD